MNEWAKLVVGLLRSAVTLRLPSSFSPFRCCFGSSSPASYDSDWWRGRGAATSSFETSLSLPGIVVVVNDNHYDHQQKAATDDDDDDVDYFKSKGVYDGVCAELMDLMGPVIVLNEKRHDQKGNAAWPAAYEPFLDNTALMLSDADNDNDNQDDDSCCYHLVCPDYEYTGVAIAIGQKDLKTGLPPVFSGSSNPDLATAYTELSVVADGNDDGEGNLVVNLVVWMFFPFNVGKKLWYMGNARMGDHMGDWEHVTLTFDLGEPRHVLQNLWWQKDNSSSEKKTFGNYVDPYKCSLVSMTFSAHGKQQTVPSHQLTFLEDVLPRGDCRDDSHHPVIYCAAGSHGMYPKPMVNYRYAARPTTTTTTKNLRNLVENLVVRRALVDTTVASFSSQHATHWYTFNNHKPLPISKYHFVHEHDEGGGGGGGPIMPGGTMTIRWGNPGMGPKILNSITKGNNFVNSGPTSPANMCPCVVLLRKRNSLQSQL